MGIVNAFSPFKNLFQIPNQLKMGGQQTCTNFGVIDQILVIIPVRNEAATLAGVIKSLQAQGLTHIRVVDNGSTDGSAYQAKEAGAEVVFEPVPGYGRACWRGLQDLPPDIEWILFCDGDGSDDLAQLHQFLAITPRFDLIIGNRRATLAGRQALTPAQNFGNGLASFLIHLGWRYQYHDLGPLRLIRRCALEQLQMCDRGFGWTVEMQVKAVEAHLRICELPVGYRPRQGGHSKISGTVVGSLKAGTIILSTLTSLYLRRFYRWSSVFLLLGAILTFPFGKFYTEVLPLFWLGISVMSVGFVLSWGLRSLGSAQFWSVALLTRLILLPMFPGSDVWRYLWEGLIQNFGFSPYHFAPNAPELEPLRQTWWGMINHLDTSAIYPPVAQFGFRGLAAVAPSVLLFKLAFILADVLVCWLLSRRFGYQKSTLYAWNPLVIYSFAGGAHYDSWFLLPLVYAWFIFDSSYRWRWVGSALLLGISVAVKWISLPILSFLAWQAYRKVGWQRSVLVVACGFLPLVLSAIPFCQGGECPLIPTGSAFVSYGRSADLLPYLVSLVWEESLQANWYYLFPLALAGLFLLSRANSFQSFVRGYFLALLTISPIIHAWYFTWMIPFAVVTQNWGVRSVSLSAFVYFILPYRLVSEQGNWLLTDAERAFLWLPLLLGWLWTHNKRSQHRQSGVPASLPEGKLT